MSIVITQLNSMLISWLDKMEDHLESAAFSCELASDHELRCHNSETQEQLPIAVDDIVCIRPVSGLSQNEYSVLFLDKQSGDSGRITKIRTTELPSTLLSTYLYEATPVHLDSSVFRIHVIVSTGSGTGIAKSIYQNILQPFLSYFGVTAYEVHETQSTETVKELAQSTFLPCAQAGIHQTIILLSGDGGLIDVVDTFYKSTDSVLAPPCIALIAAGTGNAMAHSVGLRHPTVALMALLRGTPQHVPVFVANFSPGARHVTDEGRGRESIGSGQRVYGTVVASWGFHAALVADSDTAEYRKFGADRFQLAAKELLSPSDGSPTHNYRGVISLSEPTGTSDDSEQLNPMQQEEHMYALVTFVSRLEKEFVISPDSSSLDGRLRLVHFGPIPPDDAMQLMMKAYQGGLHVHEEPVTYLEVNRFRIDFREKEERWRRVCIDGKIVAVEQDGWMEIRRESRHLVDLIAVPGL